MDTVTIAGVILLVVVLLVLAFLTIRVVTEYDRLVVFRLGKTGPNLVKGPGLVFLIPIVDRPVRIDLREQFIEVPSQTTITKDNAPINIDFLIYWRIVDPLKSVVNVAYFAGALQGIATTTLRAVIGDIILDDVLSKRDQINEVLRAKLDEQTERWGGKITTVEIREIIPPRDVQDAMNRQLSAERNRRAVILDSEGARQANINVAEGEKQAAILRAEGSRQSQILQAEGFSQALSRIFSAARGIDERTMTLQYLEALKVLGAGAATKFIFPLEFSRLAERISDYVETGMTGGDGGGTPETDDGGSGDDDGGGGAEPLDPSLIPSAPVLSDVQMALPAVSIPTAMSDTSTISGSSMSAPSSMPSGSVPPSSVPPGNVPPSPTSAPSSQPPSSEG